MCKGSCAIWQANRWKSCVWDPLVNLDFHPSSALPRFRKSVAQLYMEGTLEPCASFPDAKGYLVCPDAILWQNIDFCRAGGENGMCVWVLQYRGVSKPVCDAFYPLFVVFVCSLTRLNRWFVFVWKSLFWDFPLHLLWSAVTFSISDPPCNIYSSEVLDIGFDFSSSCARHVCITLHDFPHLVTAEEGRLCLRWDTAASARGPSYK